MGVGVGVAVWQAGTVTAAHVLRCPARVLLVAVPGRLLLVEPWAGVDRGGPC